MTSYGRGQRWLFVAVLCAGGVAAALPAQDLPPASGHSPSAQAPGQPIAGQVVSAADGHPIPNATLTLTVPTAQRSSRREEASAAPGQTAITDAEGRYRLPPQPAGRYHLRASAPGYLGSLYLQHAGFSSAIVTGAGVPTDDLRFALMPEASLHGRVLDDTGEPVRATLMLLRDTSDDEVAASPAAGDTSVPKVRRAGGAQADDDGVFEFTGLRPGRYYLAATATPWYAVHTRPQQDEDRLPYRTAVDPSLDVAYPLTFFPHAATEEGAAPIRLKPGQRAVANLVMQAEHAVSLTVQLPGDGSPGREGGTPFPTLVRSLFGMDETVGSQGFSRDGQTVTILGVAPGQYRMRSFRRQAPAGEVAVDLSGGSATVALPSPGVGVTGDVAVEVHSLAGEALPAGLSVELERAARFRNAASLTAKLEAGVARFSGVDAGNYRVRIHNDEISWNVSRVTVAGKAIPSKEVRVADGTLQVAVLASAYAPELDGAVHAADGKAHPGSLVLLVPAGKDSGDDLYRRDESDLDGGFQFMNVLPGNYLLVAIDKDWQVKWRDPAALMPYLQHATPVVVPLRGPRVLALHEGPIAQSR